MTSRITRSNHRSLVATRGGAAARRATVTLPAARRSRSSTCPTIRRASCTGVQRRVRQVLEGQDRPDGDDSQSHGGSGSQARAVIDGLEADVVTLALAYDIDAIAQGRPDRHGLAEAAAAQQRAVHVDDRVPGAQGQSQGHQGLGRSGQAGHQVITPNPKTSGGARWNYLAAWDYARAQPGGNDAKAREFVTQLYRNVPVLDSGARGSTNTFVQRGIGDVLLAWENEAYLARRRSDRTSSTSSSPSIEHPRRAAGRGRRQGRRQARARAAVAEAYLRVSSTRPRARRSRRSTTTGRAIPKVAAKYAKQRSPSVKLFTIDEAFGGWQAAQKTHFADGGDLRSDLQAGGQVALRGASDESSANATLVPAGIPADDGVHGAVSGA